MRKFGIENKGTLLIGNKCSRLVTKDDYLNSFKSNMVTNICDNGYEDEVELWETNKNWGFDFR